MFGKVKIGDTEVGMCCMASCDFYFKQIFGLDPLKLASEDLDGATATDLFMKLGFVMAKFYELKSRAKMRELCEDDYIDWLDQFDRAEYAEALEQIADIYSGNKTESSKAKKEDGQ